MDDNITNNERHSFVRNLETNLSDYYQISVVNYEPIGLKSYKIISNDNEQYFLKKTDYNVLEKYQFLANQGVDNILYPLLNKEKKFITRKVNDAYYINDYVESLTILDDIKIKNMYDELNKLHNTTSFKRQLNPRNLRQKFDEISNQLNAKFIVLEDYIRSIENRPLTPELMPILANYQYILDAKKELIRLQKRLISSIKARESVEYSFLHNNPKLDHLIMNRGTRYLTSIDKAKIGLSSLDVAKLYVENEHLNFDFRSLLNDFYHQTNNPFYYDYYRYLVLIIFIKRINLSNDDHLNGLLFISNANSIKKYFENFKDYQDETEEY